MSQIQPHGRLPNCEFIREDAEASDWIFPYSFDYVHLRNIASCFNDTRLVFQRSFDHMTPGGWIECQDPSITAYFIDPSLVNSPIARFASLVRSGLANIGRLGDRAPLYKAWMEEVGFVDVTERIVPCPVGKSNSKLVFPDVESGAALSHMVKYISEPVVIYYQTACTYSALLRDD